MAERGEQRNGKMWVTAQFLKYGKPVGEEMIDEDLILVDVFDTTPAMMNAKVGYTKNLGNYESLRVDAGVTLPCYKEELDGAFAFGYALCEKRVFEKMNELLGDL